MVIDGSNAPLIPVTTSDDRPTAATKPFATPRVRANLAVASLWAAAAALLGWIATDAKIIGLLRKIAADLPVLKEDIADSEQFMATMGVAVLLTFVTSVVTFSMWFHRAYRNLPSLGATGLLTTPAWAVGCWFIPILNLFRPYQAAREIEVYSNPDRRENQLANVVGGSILLKMWWTMWIVSGALSQISGRFLDRAETTETLLFAYGFDSIVNLLLFTTAFAAILFVRKITRDQELRIARSLSAGAAMADSGH